MDRRSLLTALVGTIPIAGCSDLTDNSSNAPTDGNSPRAAQDNSTQEGIGLTSQQRIMFQAHGWTSAEIDCLEDITLRTLKNPTQAKFNQEVSVRLEELDQTAATIDRLTTEMVVGEDNFGNEEVFAQHTFHGVELKNAEFSPYNIQVGALACTETPTATTTGDGASMLGLNLGNIEPSHVNQDGTVKRTVKAAPLYGSGPRQITYYPDDKSKQTAIFETTVTYPEPQITIEIANVDIDNPEFSDTINIEFSIKAVNHGPSPINVDIIGPDNVPISFGTILYIDEPLIETYGMFADSEKQGETVTFAVAGSQGGSTYDEITFNIPEA
jgi:hypothetical protein